MDEYFVRGILGGSGLPHLVGARIAAFGHHISAGGFGRGLLRVACHFLALSAKNWDQAICGYSNADK